MPASVRRHVYPMQRTLIRNTINTVLNIELEKLHGALENEPHKQWDPKLSHEVKAV